VADSLVDGNNRGGLGISKNLLVLLSCRTGVMVNIMLKIVWFQGYHAFQIRTAGFLIRIVDLQLLPIPRNFYHIAAS
jgi:hypothetical protein